jgi:hypothetical protein
MGVAQDERAPGEHQVHIAVAVGIYKEGSLAPGDKPRGAADAFKGADRAVHSARKEPLGSRKQPFGRDGRVRLGPDLRHCTSSPRSQSAASLAW